MRIAVILVGLALLVPSAIGAAVDLDLLLGGLPNVWADVTAVAGVDSARIGVILTLVWYLFWVLLGLKIVAAPGRASLGCAGLSSLPAFLIAALALLLAGPTSQVNTITFGVALLVCGFVVLVSFAARSELA